MAENPRARKIADRIHEITVRALEHEVRDPRLGFVTITAVRMTGDLQHASIFYTVYSTDEERAIVSRVLLNVEEYLAEVLALVGGRVPLLVEIKDHLDGCPQCAEEHDLECVIRSVVKRSCTEVAPSTLKASILDRISHLKTVDH